MLFAPGPLRAADPTPAPPAGPEMFRQPEGSGSTQPRRPIKPSVASPAAFQESIVFSNFDHPTAIAFANNGKVFVAEKRGTVQVFDSLSDATATQFADLTSNVYDFWDRGLLGLAVDPNFATTGWVYVLYSYDHILGDSSPAPRWSDDCPSPPGPTLDGCVVSGRLSRLHMNAAGVWDGNEHVLIEDWCQVHPSHSIGTVAFGPDGALYASGGEGASFEQTDYGQDFLDDDTTPDNPCGDPPEAKGTALQLPDAEGGALRSQDLRTSGDPVGLTGTIIRVDPATGNGLPDNPNFGSPDANARRIVAYGLRNPFRFTISATNELWIGDVGHQTWEEFNHVVSPTASVTNFGWPCYEGPAPKPDFDNANLTLCENLYNDGSAADPYYAYNHSDHVVAGDPCPNQPGSVISGAAIYPTSGGSFPPAYNGALFFADYARKCIWAMRAGANGLPDPSQIETFASGLGGPVDLKVGPDGALYYVGFDDADWEVHRIAGAGPIAVATADTTSGPPGLVVNLDGSQSVSQNGNPLTFGWDLDEDGQFDDGSGPTATRTYPLAGVYHPRLKVTDTDGVFDIAAVEISVGSSAPVATITSPASSLTYSVGDRISFAGSATDAEDGIEPGSRLHWTMQIQHCPDGCHLHPLTSRTGSSGTFAAPDHGYPSSLVITLVAKDADGVNSDPVIVTIQPKTVDLSLDSQPPGVDLTVNSAIDTAPFTRTVINKSLVQVSAPPTATIGGLTYGFAGWSDGKAMAHALTATSSTSHLVATYAPATTYVPIIPVRVVDTRVGAAGPLKAGVKRTFSVAGTNGIPADAIAVTGNLTAVYPTKAGWIGLTTAPGVAATTSALNLPAGVIRANGVTMRLSSLGRLTMTFNAASGSTHAILDVTGYFLADDSGATLTPMGPTRVLDSRSGIGGITRPFVSGNPHSILLAGNNGIPADAVAVTGNLTVTGQTAAGYVSMTTASTSTPSVSTINVPVGDTQANGLTIKLNANGRASLVYVGGVTGVAKADLIFDVTGYYQQGTAGLHFYPMDPRRIFDTRAGDSPSLSAGSSRTINVVAASTIPDDAAAVASNVTVVDQTRAGYVSVTTQPTTSPTTSTINFPVGDIRANNSLNALTATGRLRAIYMAIAGARTQFIVDLEGYFR